MEQFLRLLLLNCIGLTVVGLIYPGRKRDGRRPSMLGVFASRGFVVGLVYALNARYAPANVPGFPPAADDASEAAQVSEVGRGEPAPSAEIVDRSPGMVVAYQDVYDPEWVEWQDWARERQMLENFAEWTNEWVLLPTPVTLTFRECGHANAYYHAEHHQIEMCLEKLAQIRDQLGRQVAPEQLEVAINGAVYFVLSHELGHALVHTLHLPITGGEENAVDQLAAYVMIDGSEEGRNAALAWAMSLPSNHDIGQYLSDEHALDQQRWYNVLCWVYGQDPQRNAHLITSGMLPERRARRCPGEYAQIRNSWDVLLRGHRLAEI